MKPHLSTWTMAACLLLVAPGATPHPGSIDINGGHYYGRSYHCHMTGCEMPDTFGLERMGRDSIMTDYRSREKFFNEDEWSFDEDFDGDCQTTRTEMLVLTSR
ncbi:MAG: hypothetical protein WD396_02575, partial [Pseudohongiellaceae bacterium]